MTTPAASPTPLQALSLVLYSVEAVRNGRAVFTLLATFAAAGLLLALAETAMARDARSLAAGYAGLCFLAAFYGTFAAGLILMDEARGRPSRDVAEALRGALFGAHRLLLVMLLALLALAAVLGLVVALLWASRTSVLGAWLGPMLFGLTVPVAVVCVGLAVLAIAGVVTPLAAPALWAGLSLTQTLRMLATQVRQRLVMVALLMAAVALLASAVAALIAFVVFSGGRVVATLAVLVTGVEVPPKQLMAGFFGVGLRSLGAAGVAASPSGHAAAALVGGGVVFALALVLPALVYLRGTCAVFMAVRGTDEAVAP